MAVKNSVILKKSIIGGVDLTKSQGFIELSVLHNKIEFIDILLEAGVPIHEKHQEGFSLVTTTFRKNRGDILTHRLSKGADPNAIGDGLSLANAARFTDQRRLRFVLDAGAFVNKQIKRRSALVIRT
ncbi:uncharacterized protein LY89DRAFT_685200 [Mollisia scopiformis]|uniref:Uncharacterized protein n=1 Tax=Mollisia scopiformis TaxID=149040 RepID=A0A194X7L8_MOLSC|nr:uncharacterized protein LY89DRAFT_685200 [Mollisia scopiformis]KUJ16161.1 hypothetical protein LY89DRAFT_685200 [Mollisia scopiformis]